MQIKRLLPLLIVVVVGFFTLLHHFVNNESITSFVTEDATGWYNIIAAFAVFLGSLNLIKFQSIKIIYKRKDWQYSFLTLLSFFIMIFFGFFLRGTPLAEEYEDSNQNGKYDKESKYIDIGNGKWDEAEIFDDQNNNGKWDEGEKFSDRGNGKYDPGEKNGIWDKGEIFYDKGNQKYDKGESFDDVNKNGKWDDGETFIDIGNKKWDDGEDFIDMPIMEKFTDLNNNGRWDKGEDFDDVNKNEKWDNNYNPAEKFTDLNDNKEWDEEVKWGSHVTYSGSNKDKYDGIFSGSYIRWIYDYVYTPLTATMFALLAFFVASASYRAFRIRNFEASLLLFAGVLLMLGRIPLGSTAYMPWWFVLSIYIFGISALIAPLFKNRRIFVTFILASFFICGTIGLVYGWGTNTPEFLQLPLVQRWIFYNPQMAAARAIKIGIALGIVATSFRIITGRERGIFGD